MESPNIPAAADLALAHRLTFARAEGLYVWDTDARRYLDATSGAFCVQLGYTRPDFVSAMTGAATRLPYARPSQFESEEGVAYKRELLAAVGAPYNRVILTSSGSEAVDVALKVAHWYQRATGHPEREAIRYRSGHFHGATLGALGVTGLSARTAPYEGLIPGGGREAGDEALRTGRAAAMIIETVPTAGLGVLVPQVGYLESIRTLCDEKGALWIADEVLTGFGRVGTLFAWQRLGEIAGPDLIVFGKGAGAGFAPVAGVLIADHVARSLDADGFAHFQTYGGNPIAAAVGRAVLRAMAEEKIYERVVAAETKLDDALQSLADIPGVYEVRGIGFLWAIDLAEDPATGRAFPREQRVAERVAEACRERGVLVYAGSGSPDDDQGDFILAAPPLIAEEREFAEIAAALASAISTVVR